MSGELYNEEYYHSGCGPIPYEEPGPWMEFFGAVADHIVAELKPEVVLDAGCAMGYLVAALRDRGVKAYGIDFSEYAISKCREDIRQYCVLGSITEPLPDSLPRHYDLVVTIEVLEHMDEEDGRRAIRNLTGLSEQILFSSTPDDTEEPTHVNVRPREYWARMFAENGFYDDLGYRPVYVTPHAVCFRKEIDNLQRIESYERFIQNSEQEIQRQQQEIQRQQQELQRQQQELLALNGRLTELSEESSRKAVDYERVISKKETEIQRLQEELSALNGRFTEASERSAQKIGEYEHIIQSSEAENKGQRKALVKLNGKLTETTKKLDETECLAAERQEEINILREELNETKKAYESISKSLTYKISKPFRIISGDVKRLLCPRAEKSLIQKGFLSLRRNGLRVTWLKTKQKLFGQDYTQLAKQALFSEKELEQQRAHRFPREIKFSIVVPLYNTPEKFLREMIESVIAQTYSGWELCMADGSDGQHGDVKRICMEYAENDSRIRYRRLKKNLGISGNTNACLEMAGGDYIGLFDHDDLLHPAALYEVMRTICEKDADFIFTDECTFHEVPEDATLPHFKPVFAPDTLRTNNYICHFTVFKRSLLDEVGLFDPECDGSQDHDMVLRLTEKAQHVMHIPEILYYWRAHKDSVAGDMGSKPYTIKAGVRAVEKQLERLGMEGEVAPVLQGIPIYRVCYKIAGEPKVSILIRESGHQEALKVCLDSITEKTTWPNYEIVIAADGSSPEKDIYFDMLRKTYKNLRVAVCDGKSGNSALINRGAQFCNGEYLLLLNSDTKIITPDWIEELLMFAQRRDVGAVGARLYYPDDTVRHAGIGIGLCGETGRFFKGVSKANYGYMGRLLYSQNLSAVSGECIMLRRDVWEDAKGLDEGLSSLYDADLCLRLRQGGYFIVWTPYSELYYYGPKNDIPDDGDNKHERRRSESSRFRQRWKKVLESGDPYYNPNFSLDREDFFYLKVVRPHDSRC